MKKDEKASVTLKKIIAISLTFVFIFAISVVAGNIKPNSVKIKFSNNHEITVLTTKTKISEILEDNHIMLASNETVTPGMDEELTDTKTIKISIIGTKMSKVAEVSEEENNNIEDIKQKYVNITEEIITITEEIPFETITKDISNGENTTVNQIIQQGKNGLKEITYKITYKENIEIKREELESKILAEPQNQIVQVQTKAVTSRSASRTSSSSGLSGKYKVTAYCPCIICCGKTNGITASGKKATANNTIAAPSSFKFGTQVTMNGKTYTVEDRGSAIQGNRIDIYMNSHTEAISWGVKYLDIDVQN